MNSKTPETRSRLAPSFLPTTAVLEMTYRCNHRCIFCSCPWEDVQGGFTRFAELSPEAWKGVLRKLAAMGVCHFAFSGGEPLLKEEVLGIIEYASSLVSEHIETVDGSLQSRHAPPRLHLLSNGTAVNGEVLAFCRQFGVQLSLSLPGLATYREHTGDGDPDHILHLFQEAKALGIPTVAGVTVTQKNLRELRLTLVAALLAGADQILLNRFLPGGRGLQHAAELMLDQIQVRDMLDTAEEVLRDANRRGSVGTELPKCVIDVSRYRQLTVGTRCSAAISFFVIDPSGFVRTCNHSPQRLNHVDEIDRVKQHPYWRRFTQKDYLPAACVGCVSRGACDGGCREAAHLVGGTLESRDPLFGLDSSSCCEDNWLGPA